MDRLLSKHKDGDITEDKIPILKRRKLKQNDIKNLSFQYANSNTNNNVDYNKLFQHSMFNTENKTVNNTRMKLIKQQLLTFEKEDINEQLNNIMNNLSNNNSSNNNLSNNTHQITIIIIKIKIIKKDHITK